MELTTEQVAKLRDASVEKYAEIGTMGSSAPVSKTQVAEAASVLDAPLSDDDKRTILEVAKDRKVRPQIKEYARKERVGSALSPEAKQVISKVTGSYRKPWARKSAVMLEVFLENGKVLSPPAKKARAKKA